MALSPFRLFKVQCSKFNVPRAANRRTLNRAEGATLKKTPHRSMLKD
jgi:hypothetical protein